jgi:hypothetical protein
MILGPFFHMEHRKIIKNFSTKTKAYLLVMWFFLEIPNLFSSSSSLNRIEVKPLFSITKTTPLFDIRAGLMLCNNFFAIDSKQNVYFIDYKNNRILGYDLKGNFIKQIGNGKGQKDNLSKIEGIYINNNSIFILDHEGMILNKCLIGRDYSPQIFLTFNSRARAIYVTDEYIFIDKIEKNRISNVKPISIYTQEGNLIKEVGEYINANCPVGNLVFNRLFLSYYHEGFVFSGYISIPQIIRTDINRNENTTYDLNKLDIEEIEDLNLEAKFQNADTPFKIKETNRIRSIRYCDGFGVDKWHNIYYGVNSERGSKGTIFLMDIAGEIIEKNIISLNNQRVRIERFLIYGDEMYIIVSLNDDIFLAKINLSKRSKR